MAPGYNLWHYCSVSQVLADRQQRGLKFLEVEVLRILTDVCEAVSRLHHCETPIIHRDLKIENLLIDSRRNVVLCDFGSATSRILHPSKHGTLRCQEEIEKSQEASYRPGLCFCKIRLDEALGAFVAPHFNNRLQWSLALDSYKVYSYGQNLIVHEQRRWCAVSRINVVRMSCCVPCPWEGDAGVYVGSTVSPP
ncbi:unnamed protein product [Hydatigera taeniaeformis]|uniref:Protein kinase domain-containing protein n=1 Tax=Hydatigena taeniaeformis TaxID=6205 RepID=A0A0R3X4V8_HYDTA|nr:unnamed protein product [Hydatigera taeniaeformis]